MALYSNSIFTRILLTFRFPTFTLKVAGEKYKRRTMWQESFCGFYIRHPQKTKKSFRQNKIPQKFNMSLTSERLRDTLPDTQLPLLASRLNICHILDIASPLAIFRQLCQIHHFHKFAIFTKIATLFPLNRHSPKSQFGIQFESPSLRRFFAFFPIFPIAWNSGRNTNFAFNSGAPALEARAAEHHG